MYNHGKPLASVVFDSLQTKYPFFLIIAQSDTEKILNAHLESYGIRVEREKELVGIERQARLPSSPHKIEGRLRRIHRLFLYSRMRRGPQLGHGTFSTWNSKAPHIRITGSSPTATSTGSTRSTICRSLFTHPGVTAYFPLYSDRGRLMFELPDALVDEEMPEPTIEDVRRLMEEREIDYRSVGDPKLARLFQAPSPYGR